MLGDGFCGYYAIISQGNSNEDGGDIKLVKNNLYEGGISYITEGNIIFVANDLVTNTSNINFDLSNHDFHLLYFDNGVQEITVGIIERKLVFYGNNSNMYRRYNIIFVFEYLVKKFGLFSPYKQLKRIDCIEQYYKYVNRNIHPIQTPASTPMFPSNIRTPMFPSTIQTSFMTNNNNINYPTNNVPHTNPPNFNYNKVVNNNNTKNNSNLNPNSNYTTTTSPIRSSIQTSNPNSINNTPILNSFSSSSPISPPSSSPSTPLSSPQAKHQFINSPLSNSTNYNNLF
jgi:hypothetical protein